MFEIDAGPSRCHADPASRFANVGLRCQDSAVTARPELSARQRVMLFAGSIGPLGHMPASGTVTVAAVGLPLFWAMSSLAPAVYCGVTVVFCLASVWMHEAGDRALGEKDSRKLVWDELVGFMVAVAFLPFTWRIALVAFLAERVLDIVKVPPANVIERKWPGGWGVVGDDVVAGLYTLGLLHALIRLAPSLFPVM